MRPSTPANSPDSTHSFMTVERYQGTDRWALSLRCHQKLALKTGIVLLIGELSP
jgi:hypothetical protein